MQERRLALAQAELDAAGEFDVVVVNDDVARAADELVRLLTAPPAGPDLPGTHPRRPCASTSAARPHTELRSTPARVRSRTRP